jgi:hypothetical protein
MVAVIDVGDISEDLDYRRAFRDQAGRYSEAIRKKLWPGENHHLALLLNDENQIQWLGRAQGRKSASDSHRRVEIAEIVEVDSKSLADLDGHLPKRYRGKFPRGVLSEPHGRAVVKALLVLYTDLADVISALSRQERFRLPRGRRGLALNEQRDGTGLLLDIAGIGREPLAAMRPMTQQQISFLQSLRSRSASEETIINHDVSRFSGLLPVQSGHIDWHVFRGQGRQLLVSNINMEPLEKTLGVDVVYFNQTFQSFVLVQYKRLVRNGPSAEGESELYYRPERNLHLELERMKNVDQLYGNAQGDYRLDRGACWLKLCDSAARIKNPQDLIKGMYFSREYFLELMEICKGPNGGVRIGYANAPRHINNTMFTQLVKDGWIGTTGTGTTELVSVVRQVLESRRSVVLGIS